MDPPPPQTRGEACKEHLRSSSRARTPGPAHSCAGGSGSLAERSGQRTQRDALGKGSGGKSYAGGKGKSSKGKGSGGKGYASGKGSGEKGDGGGMGSAEKGCAGGKGSAEEEAGAYVRERHYKFTVVAINLGGWRKRTRYVYEWNMWNMPAWIILACEVDVVTHEQLTQETSEWTPPVSEASVQLPPQGFASPGMVHRWVSSELHRGCVVFGLAQRVASLKMYNKFEK